ncbi:MAG TPA: uroporphyrinogen decarboxylase [Micropepsaceae bacterium]|nr:uroporphyrinogen decarboxylase [Micropepsaceae bacterium]
MNTKRSRPVRALVSVLEGTQVWPPPIWLMRQAGRYLPEYRELRKSAGSFWKMCMSPDLATEITLQPIRRFDFDAAIIFSDILVIPYALGQPVRFEEGVGPILDRYPGLERLGTDSGVWKQRLSPVYQTLEQTRKALTVDKALIGFAGAPWTLAAYMLEGRGSPDQRAAKLFGYSDSQEFSRLLYRLADAVASHLVWQLEHGADAVQLFDSWAGGLPDHEFAEWVIGPTREIVAAVRDAVPDARIIGFPRAVTQSQYRLYASETGVNCIGIDTATSLSWAISQFGMNIAVQGNLDPIALIAGGEALDRAIEKILGVARGHSVIFNLGHGVLPETPVDHVARVVERVRGSA